MLLFKTHTHTNTHYTHRYLYLNKIFINLLRNSVSLEDLFGVQMKRPLRVVLRSHGSHKAARIQKAQYIKKMYNIYNE